MEASSRGMGWQWKRYIDATFGIQRSHSIALGGA